MVAWSRTSLAGCVVAVAATLALTGILAPFRSEVGLLNEGLLFLLLTVLIASRWGRGPGLFAAVVTNLALNFFFVEPLYRFAVEGLRNAFGLAIFLAVSLVASALLAAWREAAQEARQRNRQTEALLGLSRAMMGETAPEAALAALCSAAREAFDSAGVAVLCNLPEGWSVLTFDGEGGDRPVTPEERSLANRAAAEGSIEAAGRSRPLSSRLGRIVSRRTAATWRPEAVLMVPLRVADRSVGVMRLDRPLGLAAFGPRYDDLLRAFGSEAALTVQRLELARAAAEAAALRASGDAKTSLMISIAHDLKTPLASIKTCVSSVLDRSVTWSEDDKLAFLVTIESQADQLDRTISEILDLSRLESGMVRPLLKPVAALDLLHDAVERFGRTERVVRVEAQPDVWTRVDASLVLQALLNLLDNANKYSRPGGAIVLTARQSGGSVEIAVEDDGPGIALAEQGRVFERFYRARGGDNAGGSGLGLALVKGFAELCGGTVRVESEPRKCRFVLTFDAAAPKTASL
jgi:two-component system sensor histidine kinase KdpD